MTAKYRVGERVDGLYDANGDDMWYPGRVRCVQQGEDAATTTFEVLYDDGEVERNVRSEFLRPHVLGTICVGTRVLCHYDGGDDLFPGHVSDVQENGRYTIAYEDGEVEENVPMELIVEEQDDKERGIVDDLAKDEEPREVEEKLLVRDNDQQEVHERGSKEDQATAVDGFSEADGGQETNEREVVPNNSERESYEVYPYNHEEAGRTRAVECAYIYDAFALLEKRLEDPAAIKSALSTFVKQMRAEPQETAALMHTRGGEPILVDALRTHHAHAVIQCYGFVLLRRLCFVCAPSTPVLLQHGIVELIIQGMNAFPEDAILQAAACGALAVFTRRQAGLKRLVEHQVADLVLTTLFYHKTYSVHTRQVHYYGCEVLLELCELNDLETFKMLGGEQEELTDDTSPTSLLLCLLRQGLALEDKKTCCAVGSLLMCLAASGQHAAASIVDLNGVAELSTVITRYPNEPSIQKYSDAASKQLALCRHHPLPIKTGKETATGLRREAKDPRKQSRPKKSAIRHSTGAGKRKSNRISGYEASSSRGSKSAFRSSTAHRNPRGFKNDSALHAHAAAGGRHSSSYPTQAASAPQPPSRLVVLDGLTSCDATYIYKQLSKEDRENELYEAYGLPNHGIKRPHGPKRSQHRVHHVATEHAWTSPHPKASTCKVQTSQSVHSNRDSTHPHRDSMSNRLKRQEHQDTEPLTSVDEVETQHVRGAKIKDKSSRGQISFQVKVQTDNQLRVSKDARSFTASPHGLGAATTKAAKARQKRLFGTVQSRRPDRPNKYPSESLNDYASHLFQEDAGRRGFNMTRLTPREQDDLRESERLSFAEKLHKMIDRAKSTLANGNLVSAPATRTLTQPQKSSTNSTITRKSHRKSSRPSEDIRPQVKNTRTGVTRTSKQPVSLSHRKDLETRPGIAPCAVTKRVNQSGVAASALEGQRPKPMASLPVKANSVTSSDNVEDSIVKIETVSSSSMSANIDGCQSNSEKESEENTAAQSVLIPAGSAETGSTVQIKPEVSNRDESIKVEAEVMLNHDTVEDSVEGKNAVGSEENVVDGSESVPMDIEPVSANVDSHQVEGETCDELIQNTCDLPPEDALQSRTSLLEEADGDPELKNEQPNAAIDALYGDAFGDFDDNGDDEDTTDTTADELMTTVTNCVAESLLQESKSGGALYEDEYEGFDEDEIERITTDNVANVLAPVGEESNVGIDKSEVEDKDVADEEALTVLTEQGEEPGKALDAADVYDLADAVVDSHVNSMEDAQELVDVTMTEPGEPGDTTRMDVVDTRTDADTSAGHADDTPSEDRDDAFNYKSELKEEIDGMEVSAQMDDAVEDDEAGDHPRMLEEDSEVDPLNVPVFVIDHTIEDEAALFQQKEDVWIEVAEGKAETEEKQEEEANELSVDNSVGSLQSVVYDEDNFDDEEGMNDTEPREAVETHFVAAETDEMIKQPQNGDMDLETTHALADAELEERESETLASDCSELDVPSAGNDPENLDSDANEMAELVSIPKLCESVAADDKAVVMLEREVEHDATVAARKSYEEEDVDHHVEADEASSSKTESQSFDAAQEETLSFQERGQKVDEKSNEAQMDMNADVVNFKESEGGATAASELLGYSSDPASVLSESPTALPVEREISTDAELGHDDVDALAIRVQPAAAKDDDVGNDAEEELVMDEGNDGTGTDLNDSALTSSEACSQVVQGGHDDVVEAIAAEPDTTDVVEAPTEVKLQAASSLKELRVKSLDESADSRADVDETAFEVKLEREPNVGEVQNLLAEKTIVVAPELETVDYSGPGTTYEAENEQLADREGAITPDVHIDEHERDVAAGIADEELSADLSSLDVAVGDNDLLEGNLALVDTMIEAGNPAEPLTSDVNDETAYEDVEFDDAETGDTNAMEDVANERDLSVNMMTSTENEVSSLTEGTRTDTAGSTGKDESQVATKDFTELEAVDLPAQTPVDGDAAELVDLVPTQTEDSAVDTDEQVVDDFVVTTDVDTVLDGNQDASDTEKESVASDSNTLTVEKRSAEVDLVESRENAGAEDTTTYNEEDAVEYDEALVNAESFDGIANETFDMDADVSAQASEDINTERAESLATKEQQDDKVTASSVDTCASGQAAGLDNDVYVDVRPGIDCSAEVSDSEADSMEHESGASNVELEASGETELTALDALNSEVKAVEAASFKAAVVDTLELQAAEVDFVEPDVHSPPDSVETGEGEPGETEKGDSPVCNAEGKQSQDLVTETDHSSSNDEKAKDALREESVGVEENEALCDLVRVEEHVSPSNEVVAVTIATEKEAQEFENTDVRNVKPLSSQAPALVNDTSGVDAVHQDDYEAAVPRTPSIMTTDDRAEEAVESLTDVPGALNVIEEAFPSVDGGLIQADASDATPVVPKDSVRNDEVTQEMPVTLEGTEVPRDESKNVAVSDATATADPKAGAEDVKAVDADETDDLYDDGFNEFEELVASPRVETLAPERETTDDEYDEYENDEYGEGDTPRPDAVVASTTLLVSPREPESGERTDAFEDDAYADDLDDYKDDADDDALLIGESSVSLAKATPRVELSDEYEDDNDEDAEEETTTAITHRNVKEMDEQEAYESDESYADSDG